MRADRQTSRLAPFAPAAALVCLLSWHAHPGQAAPACGDTIPSGGSVTLRADIGPCNDGPALTIEGPVKVNLNGFKILCAADITGIEVTGENARIKNGIVKNCKDGVDVAGDGRHKIVKMIVRSNQTVIGDRGFRVESDNNYLALDIAVRFNGEGFRIEGTGNRVVRNLANHNRNHGFRVNGDRNTLISNLARGNGSDENGGEGFRLDGTGNRLVHNIALNSQDEGFRIRDGQDNLLVSNLARGNGASDAEAGIRVQGNGNSLRGNTLLGNAGDGILVTEGAGNNAIDRNRALDNGGTDLVDENLEPPCDANDWSRNRFGSASQDCIQ